MAEYRVLRSFDLMKQGETFKGASTKRMRALVDAGFLVEVGRGGTRKAGPRAALPGDSGGEQADAPAEGSTGTPESADSGTGGHGEAAE